MDGLQDRRRGAVVGHASRVCQETRMAPSSRDRISVDLHGLKTALIERARAVGLTPSAFLREALIAAIGRGPVDRGAGPPCEEALQTRLSLRMSRAQAERTIAAARAAGLAPGAFVAGLVAGIPVLVQGDSLSARLSGLTTTHAELATLSRNLHHLDSLLRHGEFAAAQAYQPMLHTLNRDVRAHLDVAARALRDLQPTRRSPA